MTSSVILCKGRGGLRFTSSNLYAARLFSPWTLALIANLSFPCRICHRLDDEDEQRAILLVRQQGGIWKTGPFNALLPQNGWWKNKVEAGCFLNKTLGCGLVDGYRSSMNGYHSIILICIYILELEESFINNWNSITEVIYIPYRTVYNKDVHSSVNYSQWWLDAWCIH